MTYEIMQDFDHYTVFINGEFYCNTDTYSEAIKEIEMERKANELS